MRGRNVRMREENQACFFKDVCSLRTSLQEEVVVRVRELNTEEPEN